MKSDPYANYAEVRPGTASRVHDISGIKWTDSVWMEARKNWNIDESPMSIYEAHIGSWKQHPGEEEERFYNYREFAREAVKYMKERG